MRVLILKTSSLGDVIHTFPALSDAAKAHPGIQFDWVVEEAFKDIPSMHPSVKTVIPIGLRRWRRNWMLSFQQGEVQKFFKQIRKESYDLIIDAQGLLKSAILSRMARGKSAGFHFKSAREGIASFFYQKNIEVPWDIHAVTRTRMLFAKSLNYDLPCFKYDSPSFSTHPNYAITDPNYGIKDPNYAIDENRLLPFSDPHLHSPYYVFLHGTTWATKHWPESYWIELGKLLAKSKTQNAQTTPETGQKTQNAQVVLLWGNPEEHQRALRISAAIGLEQEAGAQATFVAPKLNLRQVASLLKNAKGIVSVDTGLGHLAAALGVPTVSLYGPSDSKRTGTYGANQLHLQASSPSCAPCRKRECSYAGERRAELDPPCFLALTPKLVLEQLNSFSLGSAQ